MLKLFYNLIRSGLFLMMLFFGSCHGGEGEKVPEAGNENFRKDTLYILDVVRSVDAGKINDYDSSLRLLDSVKDLAEKLGFTRGLNEVIYCTANLHYRYNKYKDALRCFEQSLELANTSGDLLLQAQSLERMASVFLSVNDPNLSLKLYYKALPLFESAGDKKGIASVYNILGIYKTDQKEYDTALVLFEKAMMLNREVKNDFGLMQNKGNLAYLYEKQGKMRDAEMLYLRLIDEMVKTKNKADLPIVYDNLSSLLKNGNRYGESLVNLRKGIKIAEETRDTSILESLFLNTGELLHLSKKNDSAAYYFNKSIVCARAVGAVRSELQSLLFLQAMDTVAGNFKAAVNKGNRIVILKDSVYARKIRNNLRNSELGYETLKKEKLIAYQQLELKVTRQKQAWYLILFLISTFAGLLLISLIVVLKKNALRKQEILKERLIIAGLELEKAENEKENNNLRLEKIQEEIRMKEREQLSNALAIEQKNELLNQIGDKISSAMGDADSIKADLLMQIVSSIKMQIRNSNELDQFNEKFSSLHHEFYSNLMLRHPELTKTELKFCAYLKIKLSGNQIANIMNVTTEAIRKTRYRIRKKMNLSSDMSLENYISGF